MTTTPDDAPKRRARDSAPIEVGDRFITRDSRDAGKIVEVAEIEGLSPDGSARVALIMAGPAHNYGITRERHAEWVRERHTTFRIRTVVHPRVPAAVGRTVRIKENTLRDKYKREAF